MDQESNMRWYAIFVKSSEEDQIFKYLNHILANKDVNYKLFIPKRKIFEYKSGTKRLVEKILFPGYIFVNTDAICEFYYLLQQQLHSDIIKILKNKEHFQEIRDEEIEMFISMVNRSGVIDISNVFLEKDRIMITKGPLVDFKGSIRKINARKGRAKIFVEFLERKCEIDLGITCMDEIAEKDIKRIIYF